MNIPVVPSKQSREEQLQQRRLERTGKYVGVNNTLPDSQTGALSVREREDEPRSDAMR